MEVKEIIERDFIQKVPASKFEEIHFLECEEVLDNLGYVEIEKSGNFGPQKISREELLEGVKLFRKEYYAHKRNFKKDYAVQAIVNENLLTEEELDLFDEFCSLDGDFNLHEYSIPEIKSNPLLARVLNYRLHTLNISDRKIDAAYNENTAAYLEKIGSWSGLESTVECIEVIGNIELLYDKIILQSKFANSSFNHIIYFTNKVDTKAERQFRFVNKPEIFEHGFAGYPNRIVKQFEQTKKQNKKQFKVKVADELNQFMIRITQIRLWLSGIYEGRLDSNMGALSLNAFKDSLAVYRSLLGNKKGVSINSLIVYLKKDKWAINAVFFNIYLKEIAKYTEENVTGNEEKVETINQKIEELYFKIEEKQKPEFLVEFNELLEKGTAANYKVKDFRKTKSRGVKWLYKTISGYIGKVVGVIKQGLQKVIEKLKVLFTLVKNGINIIYRELKKIYNLLSAGLAFFFGKREIESGNEVATIHTNFDFNFDSITSCNNTDQELIQLQLEKCRTNIVALQDTSAFLGKAVNIMLKIMSGPLGWLRLGIELIGLLGKDSFSYNRFSFE